MKKKKINKQIPAYAFGINDAVGMIDLLGTGMQSFGNGSGTNIVGGTLSGAAKGASAGSIAGPIGTAIGGGVGLLGGLFGGLKSRSAERERLARERTGRNTSIGLNNTATMSQDYWDNNNLAYTFANGGMMPNLDLAYLDNNEVVRSNDGQLITMPDMTSTTDPYLVSTANIESVLSDKIRNPNTNQTFAQDGQDLDKKYRKKRSKRNDMFARNTNDLNDINLQMEYDALLTGQELVKASKGIEPKTKQLTNIPAYAWGDDGTNLNQYQTFSQNLPSMFNTPMDLGFSRTSLTPQFNGMDGFTPRGRLPWVPGPGSFGAAEALNTPVASVPTTYSGRSMTRGTTQTPTQTTSPVNTSIPTNPIMSTLPGSLTGVTVPNVASIPETFDSSAIVNPNNDIGSTNNSNGFNFGNFMSLSPVFSNLIGSFSNPEIESPEINPYTGAINNSMSRRRYNINPARTANSRSRAINNYNASQLNPNTGANLALRNQMAVGEYAANADLYGQAQNANNQYAADYANMLNNLGQQYNTSVARTEETNAANRAARRNLRRQASTQFGEWSQVQQQMNNQNNVQDMMFPLYADFLSQGMTQDRINQLIRDYNRYRRAS